jgi:hypothetical protein
MILHDEGDGDVIRSLVRKARRAGTAGSAFEAGSLKRAARLLIDDPVSRKSHESYFVPLADLTAYAAFRSVYAPPKRRLNIVPQTMWDELGASRLEEVSRVSGGPKGIVVWP